ncbi:uncharacterized protein LOC143250841 isoform X1 [Tachypleus tridentatus]|uniref:uncharacterized protein LOC143250841 isoform X1 n=1 Tax=Tachypleus tridentatus TaxID=6853 RepID=UPI003FCFB823
MTVGNSHPPTPPQQNGHQRTSSGPAAPPAPHPPPMPVMSAVPPPPPPMSGAHTLPRTGPSSESGGIGGTSLAAALQGAKLRRTSCKNYAKVIRLFAGEPCWKAHFRPSEKHPARQKYREQLKKGFLECPV